ncbi:hypothetical protein MNBD_GAMMA06-597 [hydrothermal vent metagenome]|uniref:Uncharacterized protein n=1 Tax=hydrothermal vent metagenome TaxID=652676 RepID=A0A3B0WVS6_9ZZZZ
MTTRNTIFCFLLFSVLVNNSPAINADKLKVGITSSLNKIFQTKPYDFQGKFSKSAEIEMAQNEYESIQIVFFPEGNFKNIEINASSLSHENKVDAISSAHIKINPIGYVNLQSGSKSQARQGFHPDILLPNQGINLKANSPQPILITVYTPPDSKPGNYISNITIKNHTGLSLSIKLNVLVHPIRLSNQRRFKSLSLTRNHNYSALWPEDQGYKKLNRIQESVIFKKIAEIGFRNHLPPTGFLVNGLISYNLKDKREGKTLASYPTHDIHTGKFNAKRTDEYIDYMLSKNANSYFIGITSDIYKDKNTSKKREETLLKYLDDLIPHLKKRGVLDQSYLYNIDEPWGEAVEHAKKIYRLVKQRYGSDIHVMQNTNQNNNKILGEFKNYFQSIDINLGFYNITELEQYRKKYPGIFQDVWWNLNLWPRTRPNLFLEYPLIDARIIGPMSYRFNIQGFEYWELVYVGKIKNYRPVSANNFQLDWIVGNHSLDGLLLYPNKNHSFYSSMRFESFRDGMEDLELLHILQKLDPNNALLKINTITDINNYSENIEQYISFRKYLLAEIMRLR